jgi:putative flippase GtrA
VGFARSLYERFRVLIHEAAKFGVVGAVGFAVSLGGADVLHFDLNFNKYTAVVIATVLATIVTFIGNRWWAFRHRERSGMRQETVLFFVFNGVGLLIQLTCVAVVVDLGGLQGKLWYNLANLCGIGLGTLFRFWSYRKWVWKAGGTPEAAGLPADADLPRPGGFPAADYPAKRQLTGHAKGGRHAANGNAARSAGPLPGRDTQDMTTPRASR